MKNNNFYFATQFVSIKALVFMAFMLTTNLSFCVEKSNKAFETIVITNNNLVTLNQSNEVTEFIANDSPSTDHKMQIVLAIGCDISISTNQFRRPDSIFYRGACEAVCRTGGTVVVYSIGNPTDKPGIRCILQPVPEPESGLTLSKRKDQLEYLNSIRRKNEKAIQEFLKKVEREMFADSPKQWQTDINGFFEKADVLLHEPQHQSFQKIVFVVSDGVQSLKNIDSSAKHCFKCKNMSLCLCGWKKPLPDAIEAYFFEDSNGFLQYINQITKL